MAAVCLPGCSYLQESATIIEEIDIIQEEWRISPPYLHLPSKKNLHTAMITIMY